MMKDECPLVSVVIPVFNGEQYIASTIQSVLDQAYEHVEIVVVDDCSEDRSFKAASEAMEDLDVSVVKKLDVNSGVCIARNHAIELASGQFIVPLDADDVLHPSFIQKGIDVFRKRGSEVDVVYSKTQFMGARCDEFVLPDYCPNIMRRRNLVPVTGMFRKSDWQRYGGYNENMKYGLEDWDFWLNFVEDEKTFHRIPEKLFFYRQHERKQGSRNADLAENARRLTLMHVQIKRNHPKLYNSEPNPVLLGKHRIYSILNYLTLGLHPKIRQKHDRYSIEAEYELSLEARPKFFSRKSY
ncbi:glycosyltransferase family A protein [Pseudovibrio sp. SPO723]|uniref:glycosyltransferase family 2 protein n=1 Tax=Nesiotobacter zosterae TaxID=392721 RepID=UPI0029C2B194|nr:glycosyltransferase family A protein [Pseudovibrio sp. SPO723]MDX5593397.1 glycosyltransferase family A protein [Pseudovibrio sp. SPO723]